MRFDAMRDVAGADVRAASSARASADRSAADQRASNFDGVLAEAKGRDGKAPPRSDATAANTRGPASDRDRGPSDGAKSSSGDSSATDALAASSQGESPAGASSTAVSGFTSTIPAVLADLLSQNGGSIALDPSTDGTDATKSVAKTPSVDGGVVSGDAPLAALLDQITQKDSTTRSDETPAGTAAPTASPDLLMLLASASPKPNAGPTSDTPKADASATGILQGLDKRVFGRSNATPSTDEAKSPSSATTSTLSGLSIETHLTPVVPTSARDPSADQRPASDSPQQDPALQPAADKSAKDPSAIAAATTDVLPARRTAEPSAPVLGATMPATAPVRSIAGAIVELASRAAVTVPEATTTAPAPIARSLTLQLSPANLGTVDVRMHMSDGALDVELSISNAQTLGIVSRERDALTAALHDSNYTLHSLVIQDGGVPSPPGGHHDSSGSTAGGQPQADRSNDNGGSGQRGGNGRGQAAEPAPKTGVDRRDMGAPVDRGGSLFI